MDPIGKKNSLKKLVLKDARPFTILNKSIFLNTLFNRAYNTNYSSLLADFGRGFGRLVWPRPWPGPWPWPWPRPRPWTMAMAMAMATDTAMDHGHDGHGHGHGPLPWPWPWPRPRSTKRPSLKSIYDAKPPLPPNSMLKKLNQ